MTNPHLEGLIGLARWWQAAEDDKAYQGEAYPDDHTVVRYVGATCSPILTAGDIRAALAALPGGGVDALRAALQEIAGLDYSRAATSGIAYQAVHIAKTALYRDSLPTPNPHEADRNGRVDE